MAQFMGGFDNVVDFYAHQNVGCHIDGTEVVNYDNIPKLEVLFSKGYSLSLHEAIIKLLNIRLNTRPINGLYYKFRKLDKAAGGIDIALLNENFNESMQIRCNLELNYSRTVYTFGCKTRYDTNIVSYTPDLNVPWRVMLELYYIFDYFNNIDCIIIKAINYPDEKGPVFNNNANFWDDIEGANSELAVDLLFPPNNNVSYFSNPSDIKCCGIYKSGTKAGEQCDIIAKYVICNKYYCGRHRP